MPVCHIHASPSCASQQLEVLTGRIIGLRLRHHTAATFVPAAGAPTHPPGRRGCDGTLAPEAAARCKASADRCFGAARKLSAGERDTDVTAAIEAPLAWGFFPPAFWGKHHF